MPNFGDMIGAFLQNASAPSGENRMGNILEELTQGLGGSAGAQGGGGMLDQIMGAVKGGLSSAAENPAAAGGIGAVIGSLLGGGGDSVKGALGGGALAMLAGVAMKALMNGGQAEGASPFSGGSMPLGLKQPETQDEQQALEHTAALILKAMINAAKSDGEISADEAQRILGKLKEAGMDESAQQWVMDEMRRPIDLDSLVREIPNQQVAAQVYAASLFAIEVDSQGEQRYLADLAARTGLNQRVTQELHRAVGVMA